MRICYVSHSDSHFLRPYVDYFAAQGHEIHVVSLTRPDVPNAINHHPWKGDFDPMKAAAAYFWAIPGVRKTVRRIAPDLVHAHYLTSNGLMAAASGVHPLVVTAHGSDVHYSMHHPVKRPVVKYVMKRAELVNPVSSDLEQMLRQLGVASEKILTATLGIDTSRFELAPGHAGAPHILCTRNMYPVYRCDLIVEAARMLVERGLEFRLTLAGHGPEQPRLEESTARWGLGGCVRFLGGFRQSDLPGLLAQADVYVSASQSDGTSLSLLEAMAAGLFPVVSDIRANREWLKGNGDGVLFTVDDALSLADGLAAAIQDERLRTAAAAANREHVLRDGDRMKNMARLAEAFDRLVGSRGHPVSTRA